LLESDRLAKESGHMRGEGADGLEDLNVPWSRLNGRSQ